MKENTARILRALFYAYVAATILHIAFVVNNEPFAFDAWNVAVDTGAKPPSVKNFFSFWYQQYTTSNPRIGQPVTYLAYKIWGFAEIGTPLAYLAIVLGAFVLGAGRWPTRKGRDLAVLAMGIGFLWFASPNFPAYMFCRAYATNYVWQIAAQIWFLVPMRLHAMGTLKPVTTPKLVGYGLLGVYAGMGNEHVGPTLLLFAGAYVALTLRRKQRVPLLWVGTIGALVGFLLVFFAPGQSQRYEGLAERFTLFEQILVRGFRNNLGIFLDFLTAIAPLMFIVFAIFVIGSITNRDSTEEQRTRQRDSLVFLGIALLASTLITMTIFASPKLGPRFFMHAGALMLAGTMGVAAAFLERVKSRVPFVLFAIAASIYAAARTIPLYSKMSTASEARLAELAATPVGGTYTATAWDPVQESWWALGDDVRDQAKANLVANYFGLQRVVFRGSELWRALGVSDVRMAFDYEFEDPLCVDEIQGLDLPEFISRDVGALQHAFLDAITRIETAASQRPKYIDLRVSFAGIDPPMPRERIYVGRWKDGVLEGYKARLGRKGRSKTRAIVLPPELKKEPWEIYLVRIGEKPRLMGTSTRAEPFTYEVWRSGTYWTLACKPDHCFVIMALWHAI